MASTTPAGVEIDRSRFLPNQLKDDIAETSLARPEDGQIRSGFRERLDKAIAEMSDKLESKIGRSDYDDDDTSVFTGRAGHAFLYLNLALQGTNKEANLQKALHHLTPCFKRLKGRRISFLCGDPGPLALAAVIAHLQQQQKVQRQHVDQLLRIGREAISKKSDDDGDEELLFPDEVLYGRAGYLYSLLFVRRHCGNESVGEDEVRRVAKCILDSGKRYSARVGSRLPLMYEWHGKQYLGAAHGVAGILHVLLLARDFLTAEEMQQLVKPSIDALAAFMFAGSHHNFPSSVGSESSDRLVQWCHGSPGVIHLYLEARDGNKNGGNSEGESPLNQAFPDNSSTYIALAQSCSEVTWSRGLLRKGYGLCHGVAGNAYAFLAMYRVTKDLKQLHRGLQFADWCCDFGRHPGCPHPPPDKPYCLMNGLAGTILFLNDVRRGNYVFPAFGM